jgi:hypothetical protein
MWEKETLLRPPQGLVWRFLKKLKIELPSDPAIAVLDICMKECKSANTHAELFIVVKLGCP